MKPRSRRQGSSACGPSLPRGGGPFLSSSNSLGRCPWPRQGRRNLQDIALLLNVTYNFGKEFNKPRQSTCETHVLQRRKSTYVHLMNKITPAAGLASNEFTSWLLVARTEVSLDRISKVSPFTRLSPSPQLTIYFVVRTTHNVAQPQNIAFSLLGPTLRRQRTSCQRNGPCLTRGLSARLKRLFLPGRLLHN